MKPIIHVQELIISDLPNGKISIAVHGPKPNFEQPDTWTTADKVMITLMALLEHPSILAIATGEQMNITEVTTEENVAMITAALKGSH